MDLDLASVSVPTVSANTGATLHRVRVRPIACSEVSPATGFVHGVINSKDAEVVGNSEEKIQTGLANQSLGRDGIEVRCGLG